MTEVAVPSTPEDTTAAADDRSIQVDATRHAVALDMLTTMLRIRAFETRVADLFVTGALPGFVHLSIGQEGVAAGVGAALRPDDYMATNHRGHGHIIAKGAELGPMMAELMGRETGYCRGKGGSMHIFSAAHGVLGANGILGAGLPIAVGAALSAQLRGSAQVAVAYFGEGASAQGAVHEAMNLAAVWNLPVVFIAEVNGFAELTEYAVHCSIDRLADRAAAYGMPGVDVDGGNAIEVLDAVAIAVEAARAGEGPSLVQATTDRWHGHYEGDPQRYRDVGELESARKRDAIERLAAGLLASDDSFADRIDRARADAVREVDDAVDFATSSPFLPGSAALEDVYR